MVIGMTAKLYIGVMSGTSLDGIDVVLAAMDKNGVTSQGRYTHPIPVEIKSAILALCRGETATLIQIGELDRRLGTLYAEAIHQLLKKTSLKSQEYYCCGMPWSDSVTPTRR